MKRLINFPAALTAFFAVFVCLVCALPSHAQIPPSISGNGGFGGGTPDLATFRAELSAYGRWVDEPGLGAVWIPAVTGTSKDWRPYFDGGHWVYTDHGWYWESEYAWGRWAFHYGRWHHHRRWGWIWVPAYHWAPSWVAWRYAEGYYGWAPLPPEAEFETGRGLIFRGRVVGAGEDFGLTAANFTYVPNEHFWASDMHPFLVGTRRAEAIHRNSLIANDYRIVENRLINAGPPIAQVTVRTHRDVHAVSAVTLVNSRPAAPVATTEPAAGRGGGRGRGRGQTGTTSVSVEPAATRGQSAAGTESTRGSGRGRGETRGRTETTAKPVESTRGSVGTASHRGGVTVSGGAVPVHKPSENERGRSETGGRSEAKSGGFGGAKPEGNGGGR